jgi:outer membrane protein assembly factor BamB
MDIASRKVIWQRFMNGQVRTLQFENDDATLYVGSGDGHFYSLSIDGTVQWRTYVGGWSTSYAVSRNYILVGGKEGWFISLLNKATGQTVWQFPVPVSPMATAIAPDESYAVVSGAAGQFGTLLLDTQGHLFYKDLGAGAVAISRDGSYLLLSSQNSSPNDTGTTWIKVIGRDGREIWYSGEMDWTIHRGPADGYAWISDDGSRMVVADANWVYFLKRQ